MKYLKRSYLAAIVLVFLFLASGGWDGPERGYLSHQLLREGGIPNTVTLIYLRNRLYDTIFEVIVFSISITGALYFLNRGSKFTLERYLHVDPATAIMFKAASFLAFLFGTVLAITGHLSPGGGFAAGVALGTSMVIQSLTNDSSRLRAYLSEERPEAMEKEAWLLVLFVSMLSFFMSVPVSGDPGSFLSGGLIPSLNILIAVKVGLGTWAIALGFLDHRWIF